jgi:dTDP-D-glucose 4,6-dehydratase
VISQVIAGVDLVVHFAAESHIDRSVLGAADFVMTNVVGHTDSVAAFRPQAATATTGSAM